MNESTTSAEALDEQYAYSMAISGIRFYARDVHTHVKRRAAAAARLYCISTYSFYSSG